MKKRIVIIAIPIIFFLSVVLFVVMKRGDPKYMGCFSESLEESVSPTVSISGSFDSLRDILKRARRERPFQKYVAVIKRERNSTDWWGFTFNKVPPDSAKTIGCDLILDEGRECGCTSEETGDCPRSRSWAVYKL